MSIIKKQSFYQKKYHKTLKIYKKPMTIVQIDQSGRHNIFVTARKNKSIFAISTGWAGFSGTKRKSNFSAEQLGYRVNRKLKRKKKKNISLLFSSRITFLSRAVFAGLIKEKTLRIRKIELLIRHPHGNRLRKRHQKRK